MMASMPRHSTTDLAVYDADTVATMNAVANVKIVNRM
jgi:hypothetical protein